MLKPEHIKVLKLDRNSVQEHSKFPPPAYAFKTLTSQLAVLSDVTVATLLNVDIKTFEEQLPRARTYGVSYLVETADKRLIGVSAATSLIKQGLVMRKHLILPQVELQASSSLNKHFIIGVFIRSVIVNNYLPLISNVEIAGWITGDKIEEIKVEDMPQTFQSKLPVVMVPCSRLNPIVTLEQEFNACIKVNDESKQPMAEGETSEDSRVHV